MLYSSSIGKCWFSSSFLFDLDKTSCFLNLQDDSIVDIMIGKTQSPNEYNAIELLGVMYPPMTSSI